MKLAVNQFTHHYPENDKVGEFYNQLTPQAYDEWSNYINFNCEPFRIVDEVVRLTRDTASGGRSTLRVLDVGAGTGILGRKLRENGLHLDIFAIDASS